MGLSKTSNFSIPTIINASDLKYCTHSKLCTVYHTMRFKRSDGKVCKIMTSHFGALLTVRQTRNACEGCSNTVKQKNHTGSKKYEVESE